MAAASVPQGTISKDWRGFKVMLTDLAARPTPREAEFAAASACRPPQLRRRPIAPPSASLQVVLPIEGQEYAVSGLKSQLTADLFLDALAGEAGRG